MKNLRIKYGGMIMVGLWLLVLFLISCAGEDTGTDAATLTLSFITTRNADGGTDENGVRGSEYPNEHMRTLRVIIADKAGTIIYNRKFDISEGEVSKNISVSELRVEEGGSVFNVYAIANEEVYEGEKEWNGADIKLDELEKNSMLGQDVLSKLNAGIAKNSYEPGYAVPQTAKQQVIVRPQKDNKVEIPLKFVVAKVRLTIDNKSSMEHSVTKLSLSGINMISTPLFGGGELSAEHSNIFGWGDMGIIPSQETRTVEAYIFENKNGEYRLKADWNGKDQNLLLKHKEEPIISIARGTELDITVRLRLNSKKFDISVMPWGEEYVDVPPFN